jgi:hypothetical protein
MSKDFYLPRLLAHWNPTRGAWETGQQDLLSTLSELYLETWPASGMTRNGVAYELPTPELPTIGTGSSLLPTPSAMVANDGEQPETWLARRERVKASRSNGNGMGMPLTIAAILLARGDLSNLPSTTGND